MREELSLLNILSPRIENKCGLKMGFMGFMGFKQYFEESYLWNAIGMCKERIKRHRTE